MAKFHLNSPINDLLSPNSEGFCFYWVFMNMEVITEQRWDDEKVKDYISQFKTKVEFAKSPEYGSIYSFYRRNNDLEKLQDLTSGLEAKQKNRDYDYVKNYISQFNTYEDFRDSPEYRAIHSAIYKNYGKETWAELISPLVKERETWNLDKVKKYISQFNALSDLKKSNKGNAIANYIDREYPGKWSELTAHLERDREDWTIDKIKEYISQFESMYDFERSPKYKAINSYIYRQKNGTELWQDVTSGLKRKIFKGARRVSDALKDLGYSEDEIVFEKIIEGCFSFKSTEKKCFPLRFDVYLIDKDGKQICIEYDGKQHFEPVDLYGGELRYKEQIINDMLKNQYTKDNDIKLIRIGYKDFKNIENEIKSGLESTDQLYLSTQYPKAGWNTPTDDIMKPNMKKEYVVTESQLKRIVEQTSNERLERIIKEFIMSKNDKVLDVTFNFDPRIKKKMIEIIFDRKKTTIRGMYDLALEAQRDIENILPVKLRGSGEPYELTYSAKTVED
jgi:hypothetical protein